MQVGRNPNFGLASTDPAGRAEAIEFAKQGLAAVDRWNKRGDGACARVLAVEIHSAPNQTKEKDGKLAAGSVDAFVSSLVELMSWDWQGAKLVVEHCDQLQYSVLIRRLSSCRVCHVQRS